MDGALMIEVSGDDVQVSHPGRPGARETMLEFGADGICSKVRGNCRTYQQYRSASDSDLIAALAEGPVEMIREQARCLGVLGGMGSEATAYFLSTLARRSNARCDQEHLPLLVLSLPGIPDRSSAILAGDDAPFREIMDGLVRLQGAGCGAVAIPCNTAHFWRSRYKKALGIPLIDMIAATVSAIRDRSVSKLAILGTKATTRTGIFSKAIESFTGRAPIELPEHIPSLVEQTIHLAKAGQRRKAIGGLTEAIFVARQLGAEAIVLGCTELPMILEEGDEARDLIDPGRHLADACIEWWKSASVERERQFVAASPGRPWYPIESVSNADPALR